MTQAAVALVAVRSSPGRPEGVGTYTAGLAAHLAACGVETEVWVQRGPGEDGRAAGGVRLIPVWRPGVMLGADLLRRLRRARPRILHVQFEHGIFGGGSGVASLLAALLLARAVFRQKIVATVHQVPSSRDLDPETLRRLGIHRRAWVAHLLLRAAMAALGRAADRLVVHAEIFKRRLVQEWEQRRERVCVLPHGTSPADAEQDVPERHRVLVFGYVKWYKGIDIAVEAFRHLAGDFPGWTLTIAGVPPSRGPSGRDEYSDSLRALAAPLGTQVEFPGYVEEGEVESLVRSAAVVLFPYRILFAASGPLALAMGLHVPFIVSEVLRPLCPRWPFWSRGDAGDLVRVLRPLMASEDLRARARRIAARQAADTDWTAVAARTAELYEEIAPFGSTLTHALTA